MLIHFAFGQLGKNGEVEKQTGLIINCILKEKRLKVSKCIEFIPALSPAESKVIPIERLTSTNKGVEATIMADEISKLEDAPAATFLIYEVPMICFMETALNKLKSTPHQQEYGKFGIILTKIFLQKNRVRRVQYYQETQLIKDPKVLRWNRLANRKDDVSKEERETLAMEILRYHKPAIQTKSLLKLRAKVSRQGDDVTIEHFTYDRYPLGYDFRREHEWRIAFDDGIEYLNFEEQDLFMTIVPNEEIRDQITEFFNKNWTYQPQVRVYPGSI